MTVTFLDQACGFLGAQLASSLPVDLRARSFWCGAVAARDLGAEDVVREDLTAVARGTGLMATLPGSAADVAHLIRWGFLRRNPFATARSST